MMDPMARVVAVAALFTALGATDDEMKDAMAMLNRHPVPDGPLEALQVARDALQLVRLERAQ